MSALFLLLAFLLYLALTALATVLAAALTSSARRWDEPNPGDRP